MERARTSPAARRVLESWAAAEWFTGRPPLPAELQVTVFKVDGEINTDDLSPAGDAATRPDIPLHALAMGKARFPGGVARVAALRKAGAAVAFVGDVLGTGSSRKSACNSLLWHIGEYVPFVPNKRRGGVIVGGAIAPIFFNTAQDSGALPIRADVTRLETGDVLVVDTVRGELRRADAGGRGVVLARFALAPVTRVTNTAPAAGCRSSWARAHRARARRWGSPPPSSSPARRTPPPRRGRATRSRRRWSAAPAGSPARSPAARTSRGSPPSARRTRPAR